VKPKQKGPRILATLVIDLALLARLSSSRYETAMTAYQSASSFQPYLLPGERILWTGRPKQGFTLRPMDALLIPFSLIWTGIVIAMFLPTMDFGPSGSPNLILIFFLLIGIYFSVGRFIHDAALRRRTSYALTDERALFLRGSKLTSLDLAHLPKLELSERANGIGTIAFQDDNFATINRYSGLNWWVPSMIVSSGFFGIERARDVYCMIREKSGRSSSF
jgi:hypothetical protein